MAVRTNENDWASPILALISTLLIFVIFGAFILCQALTGLFLRYVLNPLFDNVFDRNDGLVVLASAALWIVGGWLCVPLIYDSDPPANLWSLVWTVTLVSLGWGIAIGGGLILTWWAEAEIQARPPDFTEIAELPRSFYHPSGNGEGRQLPEPTEDELEGVILGVEWPEKQR